MAAALCRAVVCGLTIGAISSVPAAGQSVSEPFIAAVTAESTFVRSGADSRYYPLGQLFTGDVVKVIGEKSGWARVATAGPAFAEFFGFIKHPRAEAGALEISTDGKSALVIDTLDLFAPNLDAGYDPASSWKPVMTVPPQRTLRLIETVAYQGDVVHRVALPGDAQVWIDMRHLRNATPAEIVAWEAALADAPVETGPPAPEVREVSVIPVEQSQPKANVGAAIEPATPAPKTERAAAPRPANPNAATRTAEKRLARIMLDDLEAAYARMLNESIEEAEVEPLRQLYIDLASRNPGNRPITHFAASRARQLALWAEVQQQKAELAELRVKARLAAQDAETSRMNLEATEEYVAVGRLEASTLYNGETLPQLLRLRDTVMGRTLGYLQTGKEFDLVPMIGRRVGIVGNRAYHGGLRVVVITPRRIDVLD